MKPVVFHASARDLIRGFPHEVRDRLGKVLYLIQCGERLSMPLVRPMPSVTPGVMEIRIRSEDGQFRVLYYSIYGDAILVLHAFRKKSQRTPLAAMELARKRLKEMLND